jgi:hypothetical protein
MDILDELGPIDVEIAEWLISVLPESWRSGLLEIQYVPLAEDEIGLAHKITNPDGSPGPVSPPDEIYEASFRLYDLFVRSGHPWRRVEYLVTQAAGGAWEMQASFEYEGPATQK